MKDNKKSSADKNNVINLFTRTPWQAGFDDQIIRLSPEVDGFEMLYSNSNDPSRVFNMKILCWRINKKGEVDAMIPWLGKLQSCRKLNDPLNGHWQGYIDKARNNIFYEPPEHKVNELTSAASYFSNTCDQKGVVQEMPDTIGTHAIFSSDGFSTMTLTQVVSWRLMNTGKIHAMIADMEKVTTTPVLPGDECLQQVEQKPGFKYFFHHVIANKLKKGDENTLEALSRLRDL